LYDRLKANGVRITLALVLLTGAALRLYNTNWDSFQHAHPDERWITMVAMGIRWPGSLREALNPAASTLNPFYDAGSGAHRHFAYGHFPLYLLRIVANLLTMLAPLAERFAQPWLAQALSRLSDYDHLSLVGRVLAALIDTGTVLLVYLLGKQVYGRRVGLLAATLVAFTVMHIQLAHFYAVDPVTTFFAVAAIYFAVGVAQQGNPSSSILAGACAGLAVASKFSAMPLILAIAFAHLIWALRQEPIQLKRGFACLVVSLMTSGLVFFISSPFAILDYRSYIASVAEQGAMVRRIADLPYTRQYVNTPKFIYQIEQQLLWGMGIPLGLVAFAGLAFVVLRSLSRRRCGEEWVILAWVIPYFLLTGSFEVKFVRYMLPLLPFLCLMGAEMLFALKDAAGRIQEARYRRWASGIWHLALSIVLLSAGLYSLAFVSIYTRPHTWVEASEWIYGHIPDGSTLATEHWDDELPKSLREPGQNVSAHGYRTLKLNLYERDDAQKYAHIIETLRRADYVILASNRLYGSIPRLPQRYPITTRYYELLFAEKLGYRLAATFTSYPSLLGFTLVDDRADESFTVYDHPKVLIFEKVEDLSDEEFEALFADSLEMAGKPQLEVKIDKDLMLDEPVDQLPVIDDRGWNPIANSHPILSIITWWLAVELLGLAALPLTFAAFGNLSDRGYILAKTLGLLLVAYLTWIAASLRLPLTGSAERLLTNSLPTIVLSLSLLSFLSLYLLRRNRESIVVFWRGQKRLILFNEALFSLAFLLFVGIRLLNPDLWQPWLGGEKSMEFAFLNAILKSPYFPPYDPYFAGGYINYYYYGQFIVSILIKLTGIVSSVAFNLAVPTLFALTVSNAFCVGYNLSRGEGQGRGTKGRLISGLLAALFVAVLGNLDGMAQIVEGLARVSGAGFESEIPMLKEAVRAVPGLFKVLLGGQSLPPFDYWRSTRIIPFTINEFPFFSFLFADLHPHMIGIPSTILVLALALNVISRGKEQVSNFQLLTSSLCLGAVAVINTWDLPTYLGIILCSLLIQQYLVKRQINILASFVLFVAIPVLSLLFYLPFFMHYKALHVGIGLVRTRTAIGPFIVIWGFFLFVVGSFLLARLLNRGARNGLLRLTRLVLSRWEKLPHLLELYGALVRRPRAEYVLSLCGLGATLVLVVALALLRQWVFALLIPPIALALLLFLREDASGEELFTLLLACTGLMILLGCEVVFLKDFLQGGDHYRMNTIFKFYTQAWVLLGIAAAVGLRYIWGHLTQVKSARLRYGWLGVLLFLLLSSCVYPILGTRSRVNDRFPGARPPIGTLDGMAYMTVGSYAWPDTSNVIELKYDYQAIQWLLESVKGTPVIAEAALPYYREGGLRVASYTGLPTLLGAHQSEQRYDWQVGERDGEARDFFNTPDIDRALQLIRKLRISYIYIGQLECTVYDAAGLAKFERMTEEGYMDLVYENERVKIYRVRGQEGTT